MRWWYETGAFSGSHLCVPTLHNLSVSTAKSDSWVTYRYIEGFRVSSVGGVLLYMEAKATVPPVVELLLV